MGLSLVSDSMNGRSQAGTRPGRSLLKSFLDAELAPGLTVEQACHPCTYALPLEEQPSFAEVMQGRNLLASAGIKYCVVDPTEPGYVVLEEPLQFAAQCPDLKDIIPFVLSAKGVWVLTDGVPLEGARPALSVAPGIVGA